MSQTESDVICLYPDRKQCDLPHRKSVVGYAAIALFCTPEVQLACLGRSRQVRVEEDLQEAHYDGCSDVYLGC